MTGRRKTGPTTAAETHFRRIMVQHHSSHADQAVEHAMVRNRLVLTVMAYLAVLASRAPLDPAELHEHKARYQDAKGYRYRRPSGKYDYVFDLQRGYHVHEAAHFLPCSLSYGAGDLSRLGQTKAEAERLRGPFGEVHVLPAVFNDADQRAEDNGLRRAFERATRKVIEFQPAAAAVDFEMLEHVYHHVWKINALVAYTLCLEQVKPLKQKEDIRKMRVNRNARTGLEERDLTQDRDALFYSDMWEILDRYRTVTETRNPVNLSRDNLQRHVDEIADADRISAFMAFTGKLELMP